MTAKSKPIEVDILDMEMSQDLPYWLDPVLKYSGMHDADRKQRRIDHSDAIQADARKAQKKKQWEWAKARSLRLLHRYDDSEPRDDSGKWTSGGGGGDAAEAEPPKKDDTLWSGSGPATLEVTGFYNDDQPKGKENPIMLEVQSRTSSKETAEQLAAQFPKSVGLRAIAGYQNKYGLVHKRIILTPNKTTGEKNDAGIRRYKSILNSAARLGHNVVYTKTHTSNAYDSADELHAAAGIDAKPPPRKDKAYDPSEPRDDHGRWSGSGGDDDGAVAFVSPNVANLKIDGAIAGLHSPRQDALRKASADVDSQLGKAPVEATSVVGAWSDGAENSLQLKMPKDWSLTQAKVAMAMKGWLGDQKSALVFKPDKSGNAFLASFPMTGKLDEIHKQLLDDGLEFHTLEPTSNGAIVHVYGDNQATHDTIAKALEKHDTQGTITFGHGDFIGTTKQDGTDREQRDDARRQYEAIIRDAQGQSAFAGRDIGKIWDDLRSRWGGELSPQVSGASFESANATKAGWIKASPVKTIDDVKRGAVEAQKTLGDAGREIADKLGLTFKDPGPKTKTAKGVQRVLEKAAKRGGNLAAVTDTARGSFLVDHPEQTDQIIAELAKRFDVAPEPWKVTDEGYIDRAINVRLPNGVIAEVQMMHPAMAEAKSPEGGGGHDLYKISRETEPGGINPDPVKYADAVAKQKALYGKVYDNLPDDWKAVLGKAGKAG